MAGNKDSEYTWKEIADLLGCTQYEARRIYDEAMKKIINDKRFQAYFYGDRLVY